jgi:hypothetical protein
MPHNFQIDKCPLCDMELRSMWQSTSENKYYYICNLIFVNNFSHYSVKCFGGKVEQTIIVEDYMVYTSYSKKEGEYESSISILETDISGKQNWKDISNSHKNLFKTKDKLIKTITDLKLFI